MSLCLNMIVKDESHIIEDTLENICQYFPITYWVISDTGSSDNTIAIIKKFFKEKGIKGEIHQESWKNFSHNRNTALYACRDKADYVLIFDADDSVEGDLNLPKLNKDAYYFQMSNESNTLKYYRKLIVKNNGTYKWYGVLHEFLKSDNEKAREEVNGEYFVISGRKGNRSLNKNKYSDDAEMLKQAYLSGEDVDLLPRYAFYCAQSYRDAGLIDEAIEWYKERVILENKGWKDEVYCSYKELGLLLEKKGDYKDALYYWRLGVELDPMRAECWYHLSRRHSWNKSTALAYVYAKQASELNMPEGNRLFVIKNIYQYWSYYEWCLNAYKIGKIEESYQAFKKLTVHCTEDLINRVAHQIKDYRDLILNDSFDNIRLLTLNLNRLNNIKLLDEAINE